MGEVSPLNELQTRFRDKDFEFLMIYVREPHPGEHYHEHRSWEQKIQHARDCRAQDGIETTLLVDDLQGTVHRSYGEMPNMVYIVDKQGRIVYKAMWTDHADIEGVFNNLVMAEEMAAQGIRTRPSYTEKLSFVAGYGQGVREKVLDRAGPKARLDLEAAFGKA